MSNPTAIRNALRDRLKSIAAVKQIYTRWPSQIEVPCIIIRRGPSEPDQTFGRGELTKHSYELYVFTSLAGGNENAQDRLDPLLATSSTGGVFGAIAADRTLGGAVDTTFMTAFREDDQYDIEGGTLAYQGFVSDLEMWST